MRRAAWQFDRDVARLPALAVSQPPVNDWLAPPSGYLRPRHLAWAELLRRTFGLDLRACPACGGRLRLVATIAEPRVIARIRAHLGLPSQSPCPEPARQPSWLPDDAS